jgi:menaquinone-dependent protoporphyrinogen oxidase
VSRVLVAFDTKHGSTGQVAQTVADTLRGEGVDVHVERVDDVDSLEDVDAVVVGAPVYVGRLTRGARRLLAGHRAELEHLPVAVFALGPLHDEPREFDDAARSLEKALASVPEVEPRSVRVFGGALEPDDHRFPFNRMARSDLRDWDSIRAWACALPELLGLRDRETTARHA